MPRPTARRRAAIWLGAAALTAAAVWAAVAPLPPGPRETLYVIPRGTAARRAAGEPLASGPSRLRFTLGVRDVLVVSNEDDQPQRLGPILLGPGQTYRIPFRSPGIFAFACSAHPDGQLTLVVEREPSPGWRRLGWRLLTLLGG